LIYIHVLLVGIEVVEGPRVVNVILPEHRGYFVQHLGYFLATFMLLAIIVVAVIVLTRRRKKRGNVCVNKSPCSRKTILFHHYKRHTHREHMLWILAV